MDELKEIKSNLESRQSETKKWCEEMSKSKPVNVIDPGSNKTWASVLVTEVVNHFKSNK